MKKTLLASISFLTLTLTLTLTSFGQSANMNWVNMAKDGKTNVHDVQKAFYAWYAQHKEDAKPANESGKEAEDCNYTLFKRWEWFMEPRTYPTGNYPSSAVIAKEYSRLSSQNKANHQSERMQSAANWVYQGNDSVPINGGGDGRVNRVRFYPGNSNIMFACSPTGGLWKSTNGGANWTCNTDQLTELGTSDIAIDPVTPTVMYLATGDCDWAGADFNSISTIGVLKSIDGGNTWNPTGLSYLQAVSGPVYGTITALAINPVSTNIVFAAGSYGMYRSTNSGSTWTKVDTCSERCVEFEPFHPSVVYASTNAGKFLRSTDGGLTFTRITSGLPALGLTARVTIAVTPADSNYVYLVAEDASSRSFYGLYLSTDRGQTFTQKSNYGSAGSLSIDYGWYGLPLAVSPTNADTVLTGGLDVYISGNKGVSWIESADWIGGGYPYAHADGHHYIFKPGSGAVWYDACDGGVFKATNKGSVYTDLSHDLKIAEIYAMGASSLTPGMWLTGWQDNGTSLSGAPWQQVNGGDGMVPFIDYSNDQNMYSATQYGDLYSSANGGITWNYISGGITENGPWLTRWLQDPQSPNVLFAGYSNVWKSTNQGNTWTQISSFSSSIEKIYALIVDPVNDNVLYTAWNDSIFTTSNMGASWKNITSSLPVQSAWITGIALDPGNYKHAWVTFSGYVDTVKVFQTYNGGLTWKNISTGLPNLPLNCILFQGNSNEGIYVGTDAGVYYRDTVLNSWIAYSTGLPNVIVNDLKFDASGSLLAATYGRGVWASPVYVNTAGVNELKIDNGDLKVYPNPSNGKFAIQWSGASVETSVVEVYNMLGERVYNGQLTMSNEKTQIDLSNNSKGIYLYRVITQQGNLVASGKLVIE